MAKSRNGGGENGRTGKRMQLSDTKASIHLSGFSQNEEMCLRKCLKDAFPGTRIKSGKTLLVTPPRKVPIETFLDVFKDYYGLTVEAKQSP